MDEWTPLFWAVREHHFWGSETAERHAIIKELQAHKAKIMIQGEGVDKRWTPYELARYYNLNDEIVKELTPSLNGKKAEKSNDVALWQRILDTPTQKATPDKTGGFCDVCLMVSKSVA